MPSIASPVGRLYDYLCDLTCSQDVHTDLSIHEDYVQSVGGAALRFREWVYHRLERRELVSGLMGSVLRPSQAKTLALRVGVPGPETEGLDPPSVLSKALRAMGIYEPQCPPELLDGVAQLRLFHKILQSRLAGDAAGRFLVDESMVADPVAACRRGVERLLKVLIFYLWDAGFDSLIRRVACEGLHGYRGHPLEEEPWTSWLHTRDLGSMNHLLHAVSVQAADESLRPGFLPEGRETWAKDVFSTVDALGQSLNAEVHDKSITPTQRQQRQFVNLTKVLKKIDDDSIRRPRSISFFRRIDDGHAQHYDGYTHEGVLIHCFESPRFYDLHQPYAFIAATNPSAVDLLCTPLHPQFVVEV